MSLSLRYMSEEELLDTKLKDLPVRLKTSWVQDCVVKLYEEIYAKDLRFRPHIWVSDDWFSPDGVAGFAVPFFILHPRLRALEGKMIGYVEGEDRASCMRLMRHETGHAIDNAFHLRKNKRRQNLFGLTSEEYPESYVPNRRSKEFVRHLEDCYAQAHPDEDWAETFAVWLTPRSGWRKRYASWPALEKLLLLEEIMEGIQRRQPLVKNRKPIDDISTFDITLREYYRQKRKRLELDNLPFKEDMEKIFSRRGEIPAWKFIQDEAPQIIGQVAKKTDLRHDKIKVMLRVLKKTCRQEELKVPRNSGVSPERMARFIARNSRRLSEGQSSRIIM